MRYFQNKFSNYDKGSEVNIQPEKWITQILSTAQAVLQKMPPKWENCDGGLYVGTAGVAYMFYHLSKIESLDLSQKQHFIKVAVDYLKISLEYAEKTKSRDPPSAFLLGSGGVYAVGAVIAKEVGDEKLFTDLVKAYTDVAKHCQPLNFLSYGSDELFVGRAGYLCGALFLNMALGQQIVSSYTLSYIFNAVIQSGRNYARHHNSPSPLMYAYYDTEYLGAAHGECAILQMLMCFPEFLMADKATENDVRHSIDFILGLRQPNGNYPPALDEVQGKYHRREKDELVHWCHGAPGIVYMFAKAYLTWRDDRYLQACLDCGEVTWQKGLLKKGPGICHGVAGNGYVFLLLYRLTGDKKYLYRATKFAEFMFTSEFNKEARTPDSPYSLFEGLAGTVCFLCNLLQPEKASFPFFNVI